MIPTQKKIAAGNPGKRAADVDLSREAQPKVKIPNMPDWLEPEAQKEWKILSSFLVKNKLVTEVDGHALATLCQAWATMVEAQKKMSEEELILIGANGGPVKNPLLSIIKSQGEVVLKLLLQFGLTPAARAKIKFPKGTFTPGDPDDEGEGSEQSEWKKFARDRRLQRQKNGAEKNENE
jgi:P27 family predicted phage terminase small subunit